MRSSYLTPVKMMKVVEMQMNATTTKLLWCFLRKLNDFVTQ